MASHGLPRSVFGIGQASVCLFRNLQTPVRVIGGFRTLYSAESIGVDGYEKQRERVRIQFAGMADKFRTKMQEFSTTDSKNMIFTEDLKNMVHLAESNPEDLALIYQMMKKFNQQNKHLRFGSFIFGPVVMRMYHHLNDPKNAIKAFNDPDLDGFFDQLVSYQILCDLLHRNGMYQEVLDAYQNNVQSYELALQLLTEMKEVGVDPVRRVLTYASSLALNQNAPNVALEILSTVQQANYVTVRNLKIAALSDIGRPDDALPILRWSLEFDNPEGADQRATVCADVLEKVSMAIEKLENNEASAEFQRIHKALTETKQISTQTLQALQDTEIVAVNKGFNNPNTNLRRQNIQRSFRIGRSIDLQPRRNPMYERERRSIQGE